MVRCAGVASLEFGGAAANSGRLGGLAARSRPRVPRPFP